VTGDTYPVRGSRVKALLPILDEMVGGGRVTMEKVRVLKYAPVKQKPSS
jgi:hypothetical protein